MSFEMKPEQGLDLLHDIALAMVRETKPEGMADFTHRQLAILLTVYLEQPPHTVRGLARKLGVTKPVITRALDSMGKQEIIARRRDEADRRVVRLFVTKVGAKVLKQAPDPASGRLPEVLGRLSNQELAALELALQSLSRELGVKVIHCSERDTQISDKPKLVDEFVNTWSIEGFREEGQTTAEMGWGTHEKWLPPFAHKHKEGPKNQICLARMGMDTWVRTWVPNYTIRGMVVRHGEAFTISDHLTVWEKGKPVYRPTVHYAYCPSDAAIASLNEMRGYDYKLNDNQRIMNDEITSGSDILGALIMGHPFNSWWTGSDLSIEESRRLVPHQNATTMQVAISVVAATLWMIDNPEMGVVVPDDLPHEFVLGVSKPYLGDFISTRSDWTPLKHFKPAFPGYTKPDFDRKDPWQFKNFLVKDGE